MTEVGQCLCHVCGKTSFRAYYHGGPGRNGVILMRKGKNYYLAPAVAGNHDPSELGTEQYVLANRKGLENGLPDRIEVINKQGGSSFTMFRCCPECDNIHTNLFAQCGVAPTYSIAIAGAVGSGKTSWLRAIGAATNQNLLRNARYPYRISAKSTPESDVSIATARDGTGETRYLTIEEDAGTRDESRRICAGVLLRDYGGELFDGSADSTSPAQTRLLSEADAYLLFADGSADSQNNFIRAWNTLSEVRGNNAKRPIVGVVISHADKMMNKRLTSKIVEGDGKETYLLLLTQDTFRANESYKPEDLLQRIELEDLIADLYTGRQVSAIKQQCAAAKGFIVKSCSDIAADQARFLGEGEGINVYDPLIWILNQLNIFPWR